jgi:hypothetical protein
VLIGVFVGWRGEKNLRGADAPLGGLLPLENEVLKRGHTSLYLPPPLKQTKIGNSKLTQFERGTKGVSMNNQPEEK